MLRNSRLPSQVNDVPHNYPIGKLYCEDPVSVLRKFTQKFHSFFNAVILIGHALDSVSHYFFKKEYQEREASHYHTAVLIEGAPGLDKLNELNAVDEAISSSTVAG